jgi:cardiolipin synthase
LAGALTYLLIGERRIGRGRVRDIETLRTDYRKIADAAMQDGLADVDWSRHSLAARGMNQLGQNMVGSPTVRGSSFQMFSDTQATLEAIARDVDAAETSVLMEFYIWNEGGRADEVLEAVIRAARRGVSCRLLIDALGARPWWKGMQPQRLRERGCRRATSPAGRPLSHAGRSYGFALAQEDRGGRRGHGLDRKYEPG